MKGLEGEMVRMRQLVSALVGRKEVVVPVVRVGGQSLIKYGGELTSLTLGGG